MDVFLPMIGILISSVIIVMKLLGLIAWSWVWVLSPLWLPPLILTLIVGFVWLLFKIIDVICG